MKDQRNGQAVLLLLLALGIFLLGAVGLAVESSHYYTHRQLAQDAADAAAQAAITSVYTGSNVGDNAFGAAAYTCTNGTDLTTPCFFARQHGFGLAGSVDVIDVDFPTSIPGVGSLDTDSTPAAVGVTISRPITTGLLQLIGGQLATVRARGVAAILNDISPVPILVMHPDEPGSLEINGNPTIKICGGPVRSIQVNSKSETSFEVSGGGGGSSYIDLTEAGPGGISGQNPQTCPGTGGEFGNHGGPFDYDEADLGAPTNIGPVAAYRETMVVDDPMSVAIPVEPVPGILGGVPDPAPGIGWMDGAGVGGGPCQRPIGRRCTIHYPGTYDGGMTIGNGPGGNATNGGEMTLFYPGVYYIVNGGFNIGSNGIAHMMPCVPGTSDPISDPLTDCGMIVYIRPSDEDHNVVFDSNSGQIGGISFSQTFTTIFGPVTCTGNCLLGPPLAAPFWNVLFMVDRTVSTRFAQTHQFQGGGGLTLAGTLYFTNAPSPLKRPELEGSAEFQTLSLQGTPGSTTQVIGQIIVDSLQLGGNATINMTLNPNSAQPIRKLALIR